MDLSLCSFIVPSFARESAASLPGTLQWERIHCRVTEWLLQMEVRAEERSLWLVFLYDGEGICKEGNTVRNTSAHFSSSSSAFPSYISGVQHFWGKIFAYVTGFFNPTIKVVTFRLRGWCVLGVFLLPAFTRLGH